MSLGWGWKIGILYGGFVVLIGTLVTGSMRQQFDLVSKDYYGEELAYQKTIDASKNQSQLSQPFRVHANATDVHIEVPAELAQLNMKGAVHFYSPVNASWDKEVQVKSSGNAIIVSRSQLKKTRYILKININAGGKDYYQETELNLAS